MPNACDRVYELWSEISAEHGLEYDPDETEPIVDFPIFEDQLWNIDVGDEFWETLIAAYQELDLDREIPMTISRLSRACCMEFGHGWAIVFRSDDGTIQCKAGGIYGEPVLLGAREARRLARHLRELAEDSSGDDDGYLEIAPGNHVAVHCELVPASLSPKTAIERADALEKAAELATESSPVVMASRPPSGDDGPN
jgi:hypothetical protein